MRQQGNSALTPAINMCPTSSVKPMFSRFTSLISSNAAPVDGTVKKRVFSKDEYAEKNDTQCYEVVTMPCIFISLTISRFELKRPPNFRKFITTLLKS